ncbi:MAG: hypothetical protein U0787_07030 [Polyangia bacterium]
MTVLLTEDVYAYGRPDGDAKTALVVLSRLSYPTSTQVPVPSELGFAPDRRAQRSAQRANVYCASAGWGDCR